MARLAATVPDADPASTLAAIRDRWEARKQHSLGFDPVDAIALLAAAEAALKLHLPVDRGRVMRCCGGCEAVNGKFHEDCCHEWPCPTYLAITAALGGTQQDEGRDRG